MTGTVGSASTICFTRLLRGSRASAKSSSRMRAKGTKLCVAKLSPALLHEQRPNDLLDSLVVEASAKALDANSPKEIGHYRILDKLGEGGMGVVYIAEDQRLGRQVALKMLRADSHDPNSRSRLVREARLAAGISHPLICQVFELGEWDGQPFIVMELLTGKPLTARLAAPVPLFEALRIASSIIDALRVLHHHGIVHRDLKPSNIFRQRRQHQGTRFWPCPFFKSHRSHAGIPSPRQVPLLVRLNTPRPSNCRALKSMHAQTCSPQEPFSTR